MNVLLKGITEIYAIVISIYSFKRKIWTCSQLFDKRHCLSCDLL